MTFIKIRSRRYLKLDSIIGFAIEEEKMEIEGKLQIVFEIVAYLPQPINPAILRNFFIRRVSRRRIRKINSKINSRERKNSSN
jgi:hypothetical protein